jgi:A/G-specific adenine glycosylase
MATILKQNTVRAHLLCDKLRIMSHEHPMPIEPLQFQQAVLDWYDRHGRKNLPWKLEATPYKVWVSETMLQQTQVNTATPYFLRFMQRFPTLALLGNASQDQVLQHWSGLGYYARARNLHRSAQIIVDHLDGEMPATLEQLTALPGIGRSTAGAILSLGFGKRAAILDGNVKRILSRYINLNGWPGTTANQRLLWAISEHLTPEKQTGDYNQALMDMGATLCTRTRPACSACPLQSTCSANRLQCTDTVPASKPSRCIPVRKSWMLILRNGRENTFYLEKRPGTGLWGGLWVFPCFDSEIDMYAWCRQRSIDITLLERRPEQRHTFTHFHLDYMPVMGQASPFYGVQDEAGGWLRADEALAVPAPIYRLLTEIARP